MIHKAKRSTRIQEAVHPDIFWVYRLFLFCSVIGGVGREESTGAGADNGSI